MVKISRNFFFHLRPRATADGNLIKPISLFKLFGLYAACMMNWVAVIDTAGDKRLIPNPTTHEMALKIKQTFK
jgi:hypothetical protein